MKKLLFGFLGVLFVLPGMAAQYCMSGYIYTVGDDKNQKPEVGLSIIWENSDRTENPGFKTDKNGKFEQQCFDDVRDSTDLILRKDNCEDIRLKASVFKAPVAEDEKKQENKYKFDCKSPDIDNGVDYSSNHSSAGSMGCDVEDNEFIAPDLALCTVHAYNGGWTTNPTNETTRAYMREIIALKTTFMTQQMNKQYEYLESMIRRFKTQLEKAILTTRLQKAGAGQYQGLEGGSSYSSNKGDRNIYLSGVNNCNKELSPADVVSCLNTNLDTISNSTDYGNKPTTEAKKQFVNDIKLLDGTAGTDRCDLDGDNSKCTQQNMNAQTFRGCIEVMRTCLRNVSYDLSKDAKKAAGWGMVGQ